MRRILKILLLSALLAACGPAASPAAHGNNPLPTAAASLTAVPTQAATDTPTLEPTAGYPAEGYGPTGFPSDVDPLTGLRVADPALLERRPLLVKVSNLPRIIRPQWGLSLADLVFEYYTEEGTTRFAALFLGNNADMVGPIRSGRFIDVYLVRGYKAIFAFGSAYEAEMNRYLQSEFADRLVIPGPNSPIQIFDPNGLHDYVVNTADLSAFMTSRGVENGRQSLDGMSFRPDAPAGGQPVTQVTVRYSGAIYDRWDYDTATGRYLRSADIADDYNGNNEQYAPSSDRLTGQPLAFDNVVVLYVIHELYSPGIYDILLSGSGQGYAFRDGQVYPVKWRRDDTDVVWLVNPDGTPFAFKPGTTWYQVIGQASAVQQNDQGWRFTHKMP